MSRNSVSNGELSVMIEALTTELRAGHTEVIQQVAAANTKLDHTNGRVRKLEQYKYVMIGAMTLGNLIAVPIIVQWLTSVILKN